MLGGARSGKSRYAQSRAEALGGDPVFIATAEAFDDEMHERIARHRADRDARWRTVEAPLALQPLFDSLTIVIAVEKAELAFVGPCGVVARLRRGPV